jgi:5-methylcytosine-specific restriction endonuclease McrA
MALRTLAPTVPRIDVRVAKPPPKTADAFYSSPAWRALVTRLIAERGRRCEKCGKTHNADGSPVRIFGDHIVELQDGGAPFDPANVMLLHGACHSAKTAHERAKRMAAVPG